MKDNDNIYTSEWSSNIPINVQFCQYNATETLVYECENIGMELTTNNLRKMGMALMVVPHLEYVGEFDNGERIYKTPFFNHPIMRSNGIEANTFFGGIEKHKCSCVYLSSMRRPCAHVVAIMVKEQHDKDEAIEKWVREYEELNVNPGDYVDSSYIYGEVEPF